MSNGFSLALELVGGFLMGWGGRGIYDRGKSKRRPSLKQESKNDAHAQFLDEWRSADARRSCSFCGEPEGFYHLPECTYAKPDASLEPHAVTKPKHDANRRFCK